MKKFLIFIITLCASISYAFDGKEQPIKFVIPFAPGGGTDSAIKVYEKYFNELGYNIVKDYKPGADGLVGKRDYLEKNDLSGYSILISSSIGMAFEDSFVKDKGWTTADFTLITDIITVPNVLVSSKKSNITDFATFRTKIKNEDKLNFAYGALMGKFSSLILLDDINNQNKQVVLVPYKGAGPALNDVIGGHTDLLIVPVSMTLQLYEADKVNILFLGGDKRFSKMKNVPVAAELNLPLTYVGYWSVVLPKNIDKSITSFYINLFKKITSDPRFIEDLNKIDAHMPTNKVGPEHMMENYNKHMKIFSKYVN